jgi:hypothetical protein
VATIRRSTASGPQLNARVGKDGKVRPLAARVDVRRVIRRGTFTSVKDLIAAIGNFIDRWNDRCQPFTWTKTADEYSRTASRVKELHSRDIGASVGRQQLRLVDWREMASTLKRRQVEIGHAAHGIVV